MAINWTVLAFAPTQDQLTAASFEVPVPTMGGRGRPGNPGPD